MARRRIVVLGSTGSIGENALRVARHLPGELEVVGLAAGTNVERLAEQAAEFKCRRVAIGDPSRLPRLKKLLAPDSEAFAGEEGLLALSSSSDVDMVLCAIVGTSGLMPVLAAVNAGKDIAIASKEVLVMAGELVMAAAARAKLRFLPVDSEHSAIFQCLEGKDARDVARLILTASGGPFRKATLEEMNKADCETALAHPTWNMGRKVSIDSATLMNKALEIIEARWLFDLPCEKIDVVIHPQSLVHSMVEFVDGSVLAQMSSPDMRGPIQHALTYPRKCPASQERLDFGKLAALTFELPDRARFPSLDFAHEALRRGGTMPAVMNAANEVAVARFERGEIRFTDIWKIIEKTMSSHVVLDQPPLDAILSADQDARRFSLRLAF